jgi:hypothetical protein
MNGCNCCSQPPCPQPVIGCVSAAASCGAEICGVFNAEDGKWYTTVTTTTTHLDGHTSVTVKQYTLEEDGECTDDTETTCSGSYSIETSCSDSYDGCVMPGGSGGFSSSYTSTETVTYNSDCTTTSTFSGNSSYEGSGDCCSFGKCSSTQNGDGSWSGTEGPNCGGPDDSHTIESPCAGCGSGAVVTRTPELLDEGETVVEYTNEISMEPCELTLPDFPAWPEDRDEEYELEPGQGSSCVAVRSWSPEEEGAPEGVSKTESKFKWRIVHPPTGTCYFKVWVRQVFTPEPTDEEPEPEPQETISEYTWSGSGNPCIDDEEKGVDHEDNLIRGTATTVNVPAINGTTTVEILKYSCVQGYEPDIEDEENPQPNGYPDPTWGEEE